MHRRHSQHLIAFAAFAPVAIATPANGSVVFDPNAYHCSEELKSAELGWFQATIFANKKHGVQFIESQWRSGLKTPRIKGFWRHRNYKLGSPDFGLGNFTVSYNAIDSKNKVRIQIGDCYGNQNVCGRGTDYATDFRHADGSLYAPANWGAVVSIGRGRGDLYIQIQDETGAVLREDKLPVATLLAVEKEMTRLMDFASEKEARLKDQC